MAVIARQAFRYHAAAPMDDDKAPLPAERPARADPSPPATTPAERSFARRALIAVSIAIGLCALALFLWYSLYVLMLAFAAVLVAVLLRGSAEWVSKKLRIPVGWSLGVVLLSIVGFFILLGYFAVPSIVEQGERLADRLPQSLKHAEDTLRQYPWGRRLLGEQGASPQAGGQEPAQQPPASQPASQPTSQPTSRPTLVEKVVEAGTSGQVVQSATRILNQFLQGVLALFVVMVSGVYMAAQPRMYVNGLLMLTPHARRPRYREVLNRLAFTLRWWMIGQLVPMAVIGVITAVGLKVIGVELWFILGLLAALFNFVPNFGPLISGVPAFLLALADSPQKAMWVVALYLVSQNLEGYFLTPLVQRRAVEMPPALLILFQVLAGLLLGALGVVLAAPLLAVIVVAVKMLYVEDVLGDKTVVPGENNDETG
jgi:predicted PurR-regulated permease PerM